MLRVHAAWSQMVRLVCFYILSGVLDVFTAPWDFWCILCSYSWCHFVIFLKIISDLHLPLLFCSLLVCLNAVRSFLFLVVPESYLSYSLSLLFSFPLSLCGYLSFLLFFLLILFTHSLIYPYFSRYFEVCHIPDTVMLKMSTFPAHKMEKRRT